MVVGREEGGVAGDDRLGQQFDLRVVQGRQAGPCLLIVEGSLVVIVHRVGSGGKLAPRLQASLVRLQDGRNGVEVANTGNSYAQIADLALGSVQRPRIVHPGLLGYVLPGQVMRWPIERTAIDRDNDQITAKLNGESEQTSLPPPPAR